MAVNNLNWNNLPGPESIRRSSLPNGITLLTYTNANVSSIYMVGLLNNGGALDPLDKLGLAHFTASMLSRGTQRHSFQEFHRELEDRGANLSFSCGANNTWFRGRALAEDLETLIALSAESLRQPAFRPEYFERLRAQLLAGLAIREQDTGEVASLLFDQHLFPGHPYGLPTDGYAETVQHITVEDLQAYHRQYYSPQDMLLVVAGAVEHTAVLDRLQKYFGDWENPDALIPALRELPPAPQALVRKHRHLEDKSQADLILGTRGPQRTSPDYLPVYLGNNILGQFGLMGRIGESVRTRSGLAYYASSSVTGWVDSGSWEFGAGTSGDNLEKAIALIREEIRKFVSAPVSTEELDDSQSHLIGRLPLSLESNAGLANAILSMERFDLGLDYFQNYAKTLRAITPEDILLAARKYLDDERLVIASAGPGDDIL
ncbi:MAG: zinc protease [Chloroflexota bacterium]|nr:zinc protease [Chloroflexota bacterium]